MQEIWKPVKDFEGLYEVSNMGNVRSFKKDKVKTLKLIKRETGYMFVNLYKNKKLYHKSVHRLVANAFISKPENKSQVNHINGKKYDNRVENLEWCTAKENSQHAWNTGLHKPLKGENNPMYGKYHTQETKNKMSEALKGENHPMYGKHHTEETRKKLSKIKSKPIKCITTKEIFNSIKEASVKYDINDASISKCCKGKAKSAGKHPVTGEKLVWKYVEELYK